MKPTRAYLICGTPRSGSSMLCNILQRTEVAGIPKEYLSRGDMTYYSERWGTTTGRQYLDRLLEEATTPNGVFGSKILNGSFDLIYSMIREDPERRYLTPRDMLTSTFPDLRLIFITRRDKVRQAVSMWKLNQTLVSHKVEGYDPPPARTPRYNFTMINHSLRGITLQEAQWNNEFEHLGFTPYTVVYEDLAADFDRITRNILAYLDIEIPSGHVLQGPRYQKQSDAGSEEWARRYLQHASDRFYRRLDEVSPRTLWDMAHLGERLRRATKQYLNHGQPEWTGHDWDLGPPPPPRERLTRRS